MGEHIGKYELLSKIAAGGMAEIHVARATSMPGVEKVVVIKRLLPQYATQPEFIEMFLDEARIAASLNHPNIVQMYDFGPYDDGYFMAMEYLHGEDLRTIHRRVLSQRNILPLAHVLTIVTRVCLGLQHAHEAKAMDGGALHIVHRDVSPHNVVVTFDGAVKLVDFGIAKSRNRVSETRHGTIKGKVPYMAPEQLRSEGLDRRCDIYALGIILYELTTGLRPYVLSGGGGGEFALMMAIARGQIRPPMEARPDYPPELATIVMRALARRPADRYQTARELGLALEQFATKSGYSLSSGDLGSHMHELFGERLERWDKALAGGKVADHVIEVEVAKAKRDDDDAENSEIVDTTKLNFQVEWDDEDDISRTGSSSTSALAGMVIAGVELHARRVGSVDIVSVAGRLSESFSGAEVGAALRGVIVLDLAHVERITSFGVREWLAMMDAARANVRELYLARLSEAVATQMGMIRSFAGSGHLTSFYAPYLCDACGKNVRRLIDCEGDAQAIRSRVAPPGQCPTCGGVTNLDDDSAYFAFAAPHAGIPIPPAVRAALDTLSEGDAPATGEVLEKVVQGNVTRLRVRSPLDRTLRWNRALDGLEGAVIIDFQSSIVAPEAAMNLAQALRAVGSDVTSINILSCPLVVLEAVASVTAPSSRISISSVLIEATCPTCSARRSSLVNTSELDLSAAPGYLLRLPCRRCNTPLNVKPDTQRRIKVALGRASSRPPPPAAAPTQQGPNTRIPFQPGLIVSAGPQGNKRNLMLAAGGAVGVVLLVSLLLTAVFVHAPRPAQAPAPSSTGEALPGWAANTVVRQNGTVLLVGQSGLVQSEDEGLAMAQADAVHVLAALVLSEMKRSSVQGIVPPVEGDSSHTPEEVRAISERFLRTVGATSTPERTEVVVRRLPNGLTIHARYALSDRALESAVATYSRTVKVGGGTFSTLFPLAGVKESVETNVVVVSVDERGRRTGLAPGDIVVKVDERPVTTLDSLNALTAKPKTFSLLVKSGNGEQKRAQLTR